MKLFDAHVIISMFFSLLKLNKHYSKAQFRVCFYYATIKHRRITFRRVSGIFEYF